MAGRFQLEFAAFAAMFFLFIAAIAVIHFWHVSPIVVFSSTSVFLQEFPQRIYGNEQACVKLHFLVPKNIAAETITLRVFSGSSALFFDSFLANEKDFIKTACFDSGQLRSGDNKIDVLAKGNNLFFHLQKIDAPKPAQPETTIAIISASKDRIRFSVKNFGTAFYKPIELYVNGAFDHAVYPESESQLFDEKIKMQNGLNKIVISFAGKTIETEFEKQPAPSLPFPIGLALLLLSFFVFSCFVFSNYDTIEKIALSIALSFTILITLVFTLNYLGMLSFYSVVGCFTAIILFTAFFFRKNFKQTTATIKITNALPILAISLCLFFIVPVFFHFFSFTEITYWNQFYERQSAMIVESNSIPTWDELSYLGRTYSFSPGYFILEAGIAWVSGTSGTALFALMLVLSNAFLFFALFYLGKALELSDLKTALFSLFAAMSGFLLSAMSYSPRHALAFAFFLLSLAFLIRHNKPAVAGLLLAVMAFIQSPLLAFFPLFYIIIAKKIKWRQLVAAIIFAAVFTALLFAPSLLLYGMPRQANAEEWGYLITYNFYYWFIDLTAILVFFVFFSSVDFFKGNAGRDSYSKKLFAGFALGTIIQLTIIYRWNILTTTTLALLVAVMFPEKKLRDNISVRMLSILLLVGFGFLLYGMSFLNVHEVVTTPMAFLAQHTSTKASILSDPMFGHNVVSVADRAVLADLRVEYADAEKLADAYSFLETKDYGILKKYGITYTVNQVDYIHTQAIGGKTDYGIIEFDQLDKIYSNGFIFVHRVRRDVLGKTQ